jgi:hypothetical protein
MGKFSENTLKRPSCLLFSAGVSKLEKIFERLQLNIEKIRIVFDYLNR